MRITRIEIEEFGKLKDLSMIPGEGMNLIEGANESGKSTLLAFLRFVLYGFPRRSGPDGEERDRRLSWENRRAAGYLLLHTAHGEYRITRTAFLRGSAAREIASEELSVLSLSDGREVDLGGQTPGEYFLGLPAQLYDGSLYLTQSGADRVCAPGVGEAVGSLLFSGESTLRAEDAEKKLQAARRELQYIKGRGGRIADLEDRLAALDRTINTARENAAQLAALRADIAHYRAEIGQKQARQRELACAFEQQSLEQALSLFEDRARAAEQERLCREQADACRARLAALPDGGLVARAGELLRHMERTAEVLAEEQRSAAQLRAVRFDENLIAGAERIRARGGAVLLLEQIGRAKKATRRHLTVGGTLLAVAALCGLAPLWLSAFWPAAAVAGGVLAALSLWQLIAGVRAARRAARLFDQPGLRGAGMLRTYFEQCRREEESYLASTAKLAEAEARCADAEAALAAAAAELNGVFAADGGQGAPAVTPEAVRARLAELEGARREAMAELSAAELSLERAKGVTQTLSARLVGQDEAYLRARLAATAPVGDVQKLKAEQALLEESLSGLERKRAEAERAESALAALSRDPAAAEAERAGVAAELSAARHRLNALLLAIRALSDASDDLRRGVTPRLREDASAFFSELTGGKYSEMNLSSDFAITLDVGGRALPLTRFSAGCRDAAHLALRLALLKTLSKERLPLLLDEALSRFDNGRARALLDVLLAYCREGGQCFLFTCHTREGEWLLGDSSVARFSLDA